jgi:glutamate dehydrogenase (NAD(P)+)
MPDLNTDGRVMAWIMDTYSMHVGYSVPAIVTGKDISLGGSEGGPDAIAHGVCHALRCWARQAGLDLAGRRIAVQGFGAIGSMVARLLHDEGCVVVAVSESASGLYRAGGLDIPALLRLAHDGGSLAESRGGESISDVEFRACDCDVLICSEAGTQITALDAAQVRARVVVEATPGPTTEAADQILEDKGVDVLPELLAGAGGAVVSYFEWVQSLQESFWKEREVLDRLALALDDAFDAVEAIRANLGVGYRSAAYARALKVVADATAYRGIYP